MKITYYDLMSLKTLTPEIVKKRIKEGLENTINPCQDEGGKS